ncbi:hypothetical protein RBSWK_04359 [Rhodopirellula baltica SWK14]|uniref:Uncharacterized protein n=1 Tax=Rhodopirellula baltica SWK14 TaxID=993516 RepID=L7CCW0_RHOBT|nr:hypothetical protein RBSWK_04359 [Rhodopirellula baltica SWK14]
MTGLTVHVTDIPSEQSVINASKTATGRRATTKYLFGSSASMSLVCWYGFGRSTSPSGMSWNESQRTRTFRCKTSLKCFGFDPRHRVGHEPNGHRSRFGPETQKSERPHLLTFASSWNRILIVVLLLADMTPSVVKPNSVTGVAGDR